MAFVDLTESQQKLVTDLVEQLATGKYHSEFLVLGTIRGWRIALAGVDGAASAELRGLTKTDLISLADEGYITLIEGSQPYLYTASLKPKAYQQYKLSAHV